MRIVKSHQFWVGVVVGVVFCYVYRNYLHGKLSG